MNKSKHVGSSIRGLEMTRFLLIKFGHPIKQSFTILTEGIKVQSNIQILLKNDKSTYSLAKATCMLKELPKRNSNNTIIIPNSELSKLDKAIERAADIISVSEFTSAKIYLPSDSIAFKARTKRATSWLAEANGYKVITKYPKTSLDTQSKIPIGVDVMRKLGDRIDGLKLMSEALGQKSLIGEFSVYVRLFERAFALPFSKLPSSLQSLLDSTYNYEIHEIESWVTIRDKVAHADVKHPRSFIYDQDIYSYISRIRQAAYDALINKKNWHSPDFERRNLWFPNTGTDSADGSFFITQGLSANISVPIANIFSDKFDVSNIPIKDQLTKVNEEYDWIDPFREKTMSVSKGTLTIIKKRPDSPTEKKEF